MVAAVFDTELRRWIDGNELICPATWVQYGVPDPRDCSTAIKMIPNGKHTLDVESLAQGSRDPADPQKPIDLTIDKRKVLFSAAFVTRSCVIIVEARPRRADESRQSAEGVPIKAATAMTFTVWPNVRKLAKTIIKTCVKHRTLNGHMYTQSMLDGVGVSVQSRSGPVGWAARLAQQVPHLPRPS